MRILQVIHDFLPHHAAGSELYCFHLSQQMAKRHSVSLMFTGVDHARPQYHCRRSSYMGLPVYEVTHNGIYRRFEDTYADPKMEQVFIRILDEVRPDVVHLQHLLNHSIQYIPIARKRGIPVVFTLHDYWLSCPNGGQRIRPDLQVCDSIVLEDCADCIRKFGGAARVGARLASKLLSLRARANGSSLLDRLRRAHVDTPRKGLVRSARFTLDGETRSVLVAQPPSRVGFDLEVPEGTRLHFGCALAPEPRDQAHGGVAFEIRADGETLWAQTLIPDGHPEARRWLDDAVTLPAPHGRGKIYLELVTRPFPEGDNPRCTTGWSGLDLQEPPGAAAPRLAPAKSLYRAMERFLVSDTRARRVEQVQRRLQRVLDACRQVDLFISPSPFLKDILVEFGLPAERVLVSDNGLRTDLVMPFRRRSSEALRFGYVGTLAPHKGVHVLLEAFQGLAKHVRGRSAELRVHGNLTWFPDYVRRLRSLAVSDPVQFLGEFDHQDTREIYAGIDVLVVPSIWWENAPLTIREAILTGTPVIASDFGGMADCVHHGKNGLLFQVGDTADLRSKMMYLLEDPVRLEELREKVIPVKTVEQDAADMEQRYLELLRAPGMARASTT